MLLDVTTIDHYLRMAVSEVVGGIISSRGTRGGYTGLGLVIALITITLLGTPNPTNTAQRCY